ncbi:MAG: hypothetical protein H7Z37_10860 [Pyrinomonadaceae bacterium]|nr:hypothetical protein [Pyrinomonadaceae bacterium]
MSFDLKFVDPNTNDERHAHVSIFVHKDEQLTAICNVKTEASATAAEIADSELKSFILLIELLKSADSDYAFENEGRLIRVGDIDTSTIRLIKTGPKGGIECGFDEELELSELEIAQLADEMMKKHG